MTANNPNLDLVHIKAYTKFGQILSILVETKNMTSIKGHNFTNLRKMTGNNPNLHLVNMNAHTKFGQIFYRLVLKILSGNENMTSVKGHNSGTNLRIMMCNNHNLDLINIKSYTKFGKILSICSQDIERKQKCSQDIERNENLTSIKGHNSFTN